jgi:antitoxin HicB
MRYVFGARLTKHETTTIVSFRDFPEAITEGVDRADALVQAADCLDAAILFRLKEGASVPAPTDLRRGEIGVPASASVAAKAAFIRAFEKSGVSRAVLARRLGVGETELRRMLDPDHPTKIDRLSDGMVALGMRFVLADQAADAA